MDASSPELDAHTDSEVAGSGGSAPNDADGDVPEAGSGGRGPTGGTSAPKPDSGMPPVGGASGTDNPQPPMDSGPTDPPIDPPTDPPADSGSDPDPDAGPDAGDPPPTDAGPDAEPSDPDAGTDSGSEPEPDAGPMPPVFEPTYLSDSDKSPSVMLGADRLSAEWLGLGYYGVRSTRSVASGQGVFYFEVEPLGALDTFEIGVATATASLESGAGSTSAGFAVDLEGLVTENNIKSDVDVPAGTIGLVVDYRGAHPVVHVIGGGGGGQLLHSGELENVTAPLFIHLSGRRRVPGLQVELNAGNDTANRPFSLAPKAVLDGNGLADAGSALVLGWGGTHAGTFNNPPVLSVGTGHASSVGFPGGSSTLQATATDAEDGNVTGTIHWEVLSTGNGDERVRGSGESFVLTPNAIGRHPVRVSVKDSGGKTVAQTVTITATGTLEQFSVADVRLVPEPGLSGNGIELLDSGRSTHWTLNEKLGIRANQGLFGGFWYVEGRRLGAEVNQAIGLVIGNVSLNPYHFDVTPPSCSVNAAEPGVYQNLIPVHRYNDSTAEYYGFAVDYRDVYPIVYVIFDGQLRDTLHLTDVTVPIYPMLYGNVTGTPSGMPDLEINFGATAFHEDPFTRLNEAGVDTTALHPCWGSAGSSCPH